MSSNQSTPPPRTQPICPQPVYFNRPNPHDAPKTSNLLFPSYEHNMVYPTMSCSLLTMSPLLKDSIECHLNRKEPVFQERVSGLTEENAISNEQLYSEKGEYIINNGSSRIILENNAKKAYSNFLKRSTANDTKNIPKNFGKAIISFIQKNQKIVHQCVRRHGVSFEVFLRELKQKKKILHSIRELRSLWMEEDFIYAKPFRELSFYFLQKAGHRYIFGSRVSDFANHLKYRERILTALRCPKTFSSIKA